jgi:hypothetical protein
MLEQQKNTNQLLSQILEKTNAGAGNSPDVPPPGGPGYE